MPSVCLCVCVSVCMPLLLSVKFARADRALRGRLFLYTCLYVARCRACTDDLLSAIAGGAKLKKTVTVDKSAVPGAVPQPGAPPPPPPPPSGSASEG
eukprot:COSAG03_NODE_7630_length_891_cov_2.715909_2_plen_96_part_01